MRKRSFKKARTPGGGVPLGVLLVLGFLVCSGCARKSPGPQHAQPPVPALSAWPQGRSEPLKITDDLSLEVPLEYERSAIYRDQNPTRAVLSGQSDRAEAQFDFFLPDFSGYTLQNYRDEANPSKVEVVYLHAGDPHEADPDTPGEYPPNMLKRLLTDAYNPAAYEDQYGLRCYRSRVPTNRLACYGKRDGAGGEFILLYVPQPPFPPDAFPQIQARYFSKQYGGVRIAWRTHVRNLPHWHEIDMQIWKFIEAWNVAAPAPAGNSGAGPKS
jgi:hypothetical protein